MTRTYHSDSGPDCPGNDSGVEDDELDDEPFDYFECLTRADYPSQPGDSGSPVFVTDGNDATLVGVHYGGSGEWARFVPIDWIYAESLVRGYDWSPAALRPVPVLNEDVESLVEEDGGDTVRATFNYLDFNPTLYYRARLFRTLDGTVTGLGEAFPSRSSPTADFDVSSVVKRGEFTVAVKACTDIARTNCGDYGLHGPENPLVLTTSTPTATLTPTPTPTLTPGAPSAPAGLSASATHSSVTLTWNAPADSVVTGYQILRRKAGPRNALSIIEDDTGSTSTAYTDTDGLEADTTYIYRVKARNGNLLSPESKPTSIATDPQR